MTLLTDSRRTHPDTDLYWVVYTSYATTRFDDERLGALLTQSRIANQVKGLTGLLLYRQGRFLQAIEGPRDAVWGLIAKIASDPRHHEVSVLVQEPESVRRFASWSMGYRPWSTPLHELPAGFRDTFHDLAGVEHPEDTIQSVRELLEWFRYRDDVVDVVD